MNVHWTVFEETRCVYKFLEKSFAIFRFLTYNSGKKLMAKRQNLAKLHFLGIRKVLNLGLKAEKPLQNENHTEDWALGLKFFYKYSKVHLHSLQMVF